MVLADSRRISPVPRYSGYCRVAIPFRIRGYHPLWHTFPGISTTELQSLMAVLQPQRCLNNTGLGSSPFARHYSGNHYCFLFLWVLRCFSSPGWRLLGDPVLTGPGFPIRRSPDQRLLAPPRSLSQLATSFIACESQGIHRTPLLTFLMSIHRTDLFNFLRNMSKNFLPNKVVENNGFEPLTSCLQSRRSSQLS
jgi:hypothetical protein